MLKKVTSVAVLLGFVGASSGTVVSASNYPGFNESRISQQRETCTGVVRDKSGETVIGASVVVKGTTNGTITGLDGDFSIANVKKGDILEISFVGFKTQEVAWEGRPLNVVLQDDTQTLDEVVVVGFGTQKKVNLTGSVSMVGADEIAARPVENVTQALQGMVPGMNFSYGGQGAQVGSSMSINIRGNGTITSGDASRGSSASPLVLIDGVEGDMNVLNPQDIESISILKDAAAASIYGSRAPFGVILITTKKGSQGKAHINYNNSFRWSRAINTPKVMDAYTTAKYVNAVALSDGQGSVVYPDNLLERIKQYQDGLLDPTDTSMADPNTPGRWWWLGNANVDWVDEVFGGTGFTQEHSVSANGGNEKYQYYLSANYMGQGSIIRYGDENMKRYNVSGKITAQLAPWLKANYSMRFIRRDLTQPTRLNSNDLYWRCLVRWPSQPVYDPNGYYLTELPKYLEQTGNTSKQTDWVYQQFSLEIEPIKNWKTFVEVNYKTINEWTDAPQFLQINHTMDGSVYYDTAEGDRSSITTSSGRTNFFNTNIYSEYTHTFGKHTLKAMVGFQSELNKYRWVQAHKKDLLSDDVPNINTATGDMETSGSASHWATAGFFGRINYDYEGRYLAEVNLRYDGTSRFARSNRWNLFPSFSLGWNIAREAFMEDFNDVINTLKLRGSWGKLGNQNTNNLYPYIQVMPFYPSTDTGQNSWLINGERQNSSTAPGLIPAALTWEKMTSWNVGIDLGFFNNRLTAGFDWFVRDTKDMVGPAMELPVVLGTPVPEGNNANLRSMGFELDLSWRDRINDFQYGVHFLLSDDRQKITKYPNESGSFQTWREGQYLNEIWGLTTVGIAKSDAEMQAHLAENDQSKLGNYVWGEGDVMYKDITGDGEVTWGGTVDTAGDATIIGNSTPRFKFGLDLDAAWKGFDVRLFFQGVAKRDWAFGSGHIVYWGNAGDEWASQCFETSMDYYRPADDPYFGPNPDAKFPRVRTTDQNRKTQTGYLENAAYIRLKNFQLGYTLPQSLTQKVGMSNVRIFFSADNLFTVTGLPDGIDPETLGISGNGGSYPLTRTFSTGISINF